MRSVALLVFAAVPMLLASADSAKAQCSNGFGNISTCASETRSATTTSSTTTTTTNQLVIAGSGPLPGQLAQLINGPAGNLVLNALAQILGPSTVSQTTATTSTTSSTTAPTGAFVVGTYTTFGPSVPLPVGSGPGTMNCSGAPSPSTGVGAWPVSNCDFTGYQTFTVPGGDTNILTNTHFFYLTQVLTQIAIVTTTQVSLTLPGFNWLLGDLHTTFQNTTLDGAFFFMSMLLSRGSGNGAAAGPFSSFLSFAPEAASIAPFEDALAFATKAPRTPMTVAMGGGWQAWIRGTYGRAEFDGTAANFGFRYRSASGEGGIERMSGDWLYGVAFGFGNAKVTQHTTNDRGDIDTIRAGAYASWRPGPWAVTGAVTVGLSDIDATRLTGLPVAATANYEATTASAGIEAVNRIRLAHATFEPLAGLVYTRLRVDSFRETGTTFLDLSGDRATIEALRGYIGGRIYNTYTAPNGWAWTPELRGRLLYDFLDDPRGYTARFIADPAGTPIAVTGLQPDRAAVMAGSALTIRLAGAWRIFGSYDAEIRGSDVTHLVSGGIKGRW